MRRGYHTLRLETGAHLTAAQAHSGAGYAAIPAFGEYADNPTSVCFEKVLAAPA